MNEVSGEKHSTAAREWILCSHHPNAVAGVEKVRAYCRRGGREGIGWNCDEATNT
jgi:hypothetical protein